MLKNTGYFRCIDCPFGECCRRPYCHFRHRGRTVVSESGGEARGAEYDPCSPDLPVASPSLDDGTSGDIPETSLDFLELERVNKAIEAAKSEVEREQRKYEELLETQKDYSAAPVRSAKPETFSPLEYDPGSYKKSGSTDYNPTPLAQSGKGSCKYTLDDSDEGKSKNKFMEYVPTTVTSVPKYKTSKYVIDNSKPHTDMEYDPMSNYSARLLSKHKEQKGVKRSNESSLDEGYTPSVKKTCTKSAEISMNARFSDSEEEVELEYRPTTCKLLASKMKPGDSSTKKSLKSGDKDVHSREVKEMAVQYDMGDIGKSIKSQNKDSKKKAIKCLHAKDEKGNDRSKEKSDCTEISRKSSLGKDDTKKSSKNIVKTKPERVHDRDGVNKESGHGKSKSESGKMDKNKLQKQSSEKKKDPGKNSSKSKHDVLERKLSTDMSSTVKKENKVKNGKIRDKDTKSEEKLKGPAKQIVKAKSKQKRRSLSHVDLFGDESSEEEMEGKRISRRTNLSYNGDGKSDTEMGEGIKKRKKAIRRPSTSSVDSLEIDYSVLEKELDSDSDPMEECLRVFNESRDVKTEDKGRMGKQPHKDGEDKSEISSTTLIPGQKKRVSHITNSDSPNKPVIHPYRRPTPQEICYQRIRRAQEQAAQLLAEQRALLLTNSSTKSSAAQTGEKKRIAHLPISLSSSPLLVQEVKKPSLSTPPASVGTGALSNGLASSLKSRTISGMSSKTTKTTVQIRKAHAPSLQSTTLKRPVIPTEFGAKVPTNVRQRYLNLFIDECLKFCPSEQEAYEKALEEEKMVYGRSTSRNIYLNVAVNTLKKLRSQGPDNKITSTKSINKKAVSHESVLGGKLAAKTSYSLQRNSGHCEEELTDAALYVKLKEYLMTSEQLQENGYPMPHPDKPGRAVIVTAEEKKNPDTSCRVCCRCGAEYMVSPSGNCVRREECVHHWGRLRRQRVPGGWETHYNCCSGAVGSTGCQVAKQHVQDGRKDNLDGFVKTFEKLPAAGRNPGVYALDCEMCYTTQGLELTRVTVINSQLKVVYDTFVQPDNKVVDYNTRFSGVTEEDLQNTTITLRDVQAVLLCMFSSETILIGHSLESDLFALKLIHATVVDTAIVFPHRLGLPYKRALRSLMADHLKRIIQDNVDGHDSSEDACSCMELMIWKIKEDAKVKR
ncbi:RNA exonuclease 1 homolog isoform 2-T2 [Discoglossus pictus]